MGPKLCSLSLNRNMLLRSIIETLSSPLLKTVKSSLWPLQSPLPISVRVFGCRQQCSVYVAILPRVCEILEGGQTSYSSILSGILPHEQQPILVNTCLPKELTGINLLSPISVFPRAKKSLFMNFEIVPIIELQDDQGFVSPLYFYLTRTQEQFLKTDHYFPLCQY